MLTALTTTLGISILSIVIERNVAKLRKGKPLPAYYPSLRIKVVKKKNKLKNNTLSH